MPTVVDLCVRDNDINILAFWMIGLPGDNPLESRKSLNFMAELFRDGLINHVALALFIPYPGTEFYTNPAKYGITILNRDWSRWERCASEPIYELDTFTKAEISRSYLDAIEIIKTYELFGELPNTDHEFVARIRSGSL